LQLPRAKEKLRNDFLLQKKIVPFSKYGQKILLVLNVCKYWGCKELTTEKIELLKEKSKISKQNFENKILKTKFS